MSGIPTAVGVARLAAFPPPGRHITLINSQPWKRKPKGSSFRRVEGKARRFVLSETLTLSQERRGNSPAGRRSELASSPRARGEPAPFMCGAAARAGGDAGRRRRRSPRSRGPNEFHVRLAFMTGARQNAQARHVFEVKASSPTRSGRDREYEPDPVMRLRELRAPEVKPRDSSSSQKKQKGGREAEARQAVSFSLPPVTMR
ncbi:unnamed protein product [Merluccius merluccius]